MYLYIKATENPSSISNYTVCQKPWSFHFLVQFNKNTNKTGQVLRAGWWNNGNGKKKEENQTHEGNSNALQTLCKIHDESYRGHWLEPMGSGRICRRSSSSVSVIGKCCRVLPRTDGIGACCCCCCCVLVEQCRLDGQRVLVRLDSQARGALSLDRSQYLA